MAEQVVGDVKTNFDGLISKVSDMTLQDRRYVLEKLAGRPLTDDECGQVGSGTIMDGLHRQKTRGEHFKNWQNIRKFEETKGMTFQAWRRNIEPLMKAVDVPPDVKR